MIYSIHLKHVKSKQIQFSDITTDPPLSHYTRDRTPFSNNNLDFVEMWALYSSQQYLNVPTPQEFSRFWKLLILQLYEIKC